MEHVKRLIAIVSAFALSMVFIHRTRAPQNVMMVQAPIACLPADTAAQQKADAALNKYASIAHTTLEQTGPVPSYRCYFNLPKDQVPCTPKAVASRNHINGTPSLPALASNLKRKCYFSADKYRPLQALLAKKPPASYKDYNGKIVKDVEEAKRVLNKKS